MRLDFLESGDLHVCPYLGDRIAREECFTASRCPPELYHDLMDVGFRRSGVLFYRPRCPDCAECRPLRVLTQEFRPDKSQRRVLRKNSDVIATTLAVPQLTTEKYKLFNAYNKWKHGSRERWSFTRIASFLYKRPVNTYEIEYRIEGSPRIAAVSIVDVCSRSVASVYTYYDPAHARRSPGTYTALAEIAEAASQGIPYYYLGYYVADSRAMNYKRLYKPHEILNEDYFWE